MNARMEQATRFRLIKQAKRLRHFRNPPPRWVEAGDAYGLLIHGSRIVAWVSPWYNGSGNRQLGYQWNLIGPGDVYCVETAEEAKAAALLASRGLVEIHRA